MKNFQNKARIIKVSKVLRNIAFAGLIVFGLIIPMTLATAILPPLVSKQIPFSLTQFLVFPLFIFVFLTNLKIFQFLVLL